MTTADADTNTDGETRIETSTGLATYTTPAQRLASEAACDAVPLCLNGEPDFDAWRLVVDDVRRDVLASITAAADD